MYIHIIKSDVILGMPLVIVYVMDESFVATWKIDYYVHTHHHESDVIRRICSCDDRKVMDEQFIYF
jgi:hypothetical protein